MSGTASQAMMDAKTAFRADPVAGSLRGDVTDKKAMTKIMADREAMPGMILMDKMQINVWPAVPTVLFTPM